MVNFREERTDHATGTRPVLDPAIEALDGVVVLQKRAARIQHAMNNPLAALLAEGQLLSMELSLTGQQRESVERMIELTRRVIHLVRDLDDLRGKQSAR